MGPYLGTPAKRWAPVIAPFHAGLLPGASYVGWPSPESSVIASDADCGGARVMPPARAPCVIIPPFASVEVFPG
jgi:hypothetical protein